MLSSPGSPSNGGWQQEGQASTSIERLNRSLWSEGPTAGVTISATMACAHRPCTTPCSSFMQHSTYGALAQWPIKTAAAQSGTCGTSSSGRSDTDLEEQTQRMLNGKKVCPLIPKTRAGMELPLYLCSN